MGKQISLLPEEGSTVNIEHLQHLCETAAGVQVAVKTRRAEQRHRKLSGYRRARKGQPGPSGLTLSWIDNVRKDIGYSGPVITRMSIIESTPMCLGLDPYTNKMVFTQSDPVVYVTTWHDNYVRPGWKGTEKTRRASRAMCRNDHKAWVKSHRPAKPERPTNFDLQKQNFLENDGQGRPPIYMRRNNRDDLWSLDFEPKGSLRYRSETPGYRPEPTYVGSYWEQDRTLNKLYREMDGRVLHVEQVPIPLAPAKPSTGTPKFEAIRAEERYRRPVTSRF